MPIIRPKPPELSVRPRIHDCRGALDQTGGAVGGGIFLDAGCRLGKCGRANSGAQHGDEFAGGRRQSTTGLATVARFLSVPGGREYLGRVPGVATSPLSNADLSELMNWMLWRFDKEHIPANFQPYVAAEIGQLRSAPLRLEASLLRAALLKKADESATP